MRLAQQLLSVFVVSFTLNFVWEHLHAPLYLSYKGGAVTHPILLHSTLVDALIVTGLAAAYLFVPFFKKRLWLVLALSLFIALGIEWWALGTGRWAYAESMPIIPLLHVGLTPTMQLVTVGYASFLIAGLL